MGFMQEKRENINIITIPSFTATNLVEHAFTTRHDGESKGEFSSLNLAFHVGDDHESVLQNRKKVVKIFGATLEQLVAGEQVHGKRVQIVKQQDRGRGSLSLSTAFPETDSLITNVPGIILSSYYADCVPLFFLDPVNKAVGLAHAGWKGTWQQISVATLEAMRDNYHTVPENCLVAIGPSIGPCCYQVDKPVMEQFSCTFDYHQTFAHYCYEDKWVIDLWKANQEQLTRFGVPLKNIVVSRLCTACHRDIFYSYRKENGRTGRQASLIMLKRGAS
jgi:YfiH family protein